MVSPTTISDDSKSLPAGAEWADLKTFAKARQVVARAVRAISNSFHTHGNEEGEDRCRELMVKLAEDRFTLAVVGQFKRGKSSLMNAVIGRELCPQAFCRSHPS